MDRRSPGEAPESYQVYPTMYKSSGSGLGFFDGLQLECRRASSSPVEANISNRFNTPILIWTSPDPQFKFQNRPKKTRVFENPYYFVYIKIAIKTHKIFCSRSINKTTRILEN